MKIRSGFVSNSSSTSFCVIGVSKDEYVKQLAKATRLKCEDSEKSSYCGHGWYNVDDENLQVYGGGSYIDAIGMDAETILVNNTLPEAKQKFKNYIFDEYGIDIPLLYTGLKFGEAGDG